MYFCNLKQSFPKAGCNQARQRDAVPSNVRHIILFRTAYGRILGDFVCLAHLGFEAFNKVARFLL